tara:strand:+ start:166505 stop:168388 length:1884 start_codon:yes stop_codon:yes gene_type:complete
MPEASFLIDRESLTILATNQAAEELTGQQGDDLLNLSLNEFFTTSASSDLSVDLLDAVAPPGESTRLSLCCRADLDQFQPLELSSRSLESEGQSLALVTVRPPSSISDETPHEQLVQSQECVQQVFDESLIAQFESEKRQSAFESHPDALLRISSRGAILESYSDNGLTKYLRLSETPCNQILWQLLPCEYADQIRNAIEHVAAGNRQRTIPFSVERQDDHREFEIRFLPLPSTVEQIAIIRDVTQLKQTERKLIYASEQFRYLFEHSPDAIFVETPDGIVLDANQAACELHRISRGELIGKNVLSLVPPEDRPVVSVRSGALATGAISEFESRSLRSDGKAIPIGVRISTITYHGNPAVLLHVRDITQQKKDEIRKREHDRQLAHVSRLTMMGQLVAGIAHELRQPLWSLSTFADVCAESLSRPDCAKRLPKIREVANKVVLEARRANAITTRMFAFARNGIPERTTCDITAIARDAMELTAGHANASRIRTILRPDRNLPFINCDRVLIEQTFANILNNAYTALSVHTSDNREVTVEVSCDEDERDYVTVMVRDNGPGLPENVVAEQLFEGFFTTGQAGLGIGLALCRSFVEDHGGVIWAEQLPAGGMEFVFTLRVDGGRHANAD